MTVIIWGGGGRGGGKANKSQFTATRAALIHESSDNDEGALMGSSIAQYPPFELLGKPLPLEFLDSSLRTRHESRGAIVQPCDIQTHLGLRIQPNNMAHSVPKPKPQAAFRPIE